MSQNKRNSKRTVIKLGSNIVIGPRGRLARASLVELARQVALMKRLGVQVILITSGSVGLGRTRLKLKSSPSLVQKQACAAVGQSELMENYRQIFSRYRLLVAQCLVTSADFEDRERFLRLRDTVEELLKRGVVPIFNENDTVSVSELATDGKTPSFGDNDRLSSLVASSVGATDLVILTNVEGVFDSNPETHPEARLLREISDFSQLRIETDGQSKFGRGGMVSKLEAARIAVRSGVEVRVCSGRTPLQIRRSLQEPTEAWIGTRFVAQNPISGRKFWLSAASGSQGRLTINAGAVHALKDRGASLLLPGLLAIQGSFGSEEVVSICDEQGFEIARGQVRMSSESLRESLKAGKNEKSVEVVHRDDMVVFRYE